WRALFFPLALLKPNESNPSEGHKLLDVANEPLRHRRYCRGGSKPLAPVNPQVPQNTTHRLQVRHVDIEVHAVDRLVLKHHMIDQHVRHRSCYGHRRLRSSTGLRTHRASSSYNQGMSLQARPESTHISRNPQLFELRIHLVGLRRSLASIRSELPLLHLRSGHRRECKVRKDPCAAMPFSASSPACTASC